MGVLVIVLAAMVATTCLAAWQENVRPKMYVQLGKRIILYRNLHDIHSEFSSYLFNKIKIFRFENQKWDWFSHGRILSTEEYKFL